MKQKSIWRIVFTEQFIVISFLAAYSVFREESSLMQMYWMSDFMTTFAGEVLSSEYTEAILKDINIIPYVVRNLARLSLVQVVSTLVFCLYKTVVLLLKYKGKKKQGISYDPI